MPVQGLSQNQLLIDSLLHERKHQQSDSATIKLTYDICWQYMNSNPDTAMVFANEALDRSYTLNYNFGIAKGNILKGIYHTITGNYDSAIVYYLRTKKVREQMKDALGVAAVLNNLGNVSLYKSDLHSAVGYYIQSLKIEEQAGDKERIGSAYMNLAGAFYQLKKYDEAMPYYEKCLTVTHHLPEQPEYIATLYNNVGNIYSAKKDTSKALSYFNKSLAMATGKGYKDAEGGAYEGLASIFALKSNPDSALHYYLKSITLFESIGNADALMNVLIQAASIYLHKGQTDDATDMAVQAAEIAQQTGAKIPMRESANVLAKAFESKRNYKQALYYQQLFSQYSDSVVNEASNKQVEELKIVYETEKKEAENKLLTEENKLKDVVIAKSRNDKLFLLLVIFLMIIAAWFGYSRYRLQQQQKLNKEIAIQQELRTKAVMQTEEQERQRIATDLHDGVGQLLSVARMTVANLQSTYAGKEPQIKTALQNAVNLMDESLKEVRSISHNMMPNALIKAGLVKAVREFVQKISSTGQLKAELEIIGLDNRLAAETESILFRVMQELVNNIIKHSQASAVSIQLTRDEKEILLMIEDNGVGFDISGQSAFEGIGLKNIKNRIAYLNGTVDFDSRAGRGTIVTIEVPL